MRVTVLLILYFTACVMFEKDEYVVGEQDGTLIVSLIMQNHKDDTVTVSKLRGHSEIQASSLGGINK